MMDNVISFAHDWNTRGNHATMLPNGALHKFGKLMCKCFTTIRVKSAKFEVGKEYEIRLAGVDTGKARIVAIKEFKIAELNEFMARLDTGYGVEDCKKIMANMWGKYGDLNTMTFQFILLERATEAASPIGADWGKPDVPKKAATTAPPISAWEEPA
jgi:hypothetical protein